jgi:hypothetical protein
LLVPQVFPAFEHIMKSMQGVPDTRPRLDTGDHGVGGEALLVLASRLALAATLFEDEVLGESVVP